MPNNQKDYFNTLQEYALSKPQAKPKMARYHFSIGVGNSSYVKFVIKYNTLIACFNTTEIKVEDNNSVEVAKQMIDKFVEQIQSKK